MAKCIYMNHSRNRLLAVAIFSFCACGAFLVRVSKRETCTWWVVMTASRAMVMQARQQRMPPPEARRWSVCMQPNPEILGSVGDAGKMVHTYTPFTLKLVLQIFPILINAFLFWVSLNVLQLYTNLIQASMSLIQAVNDLIPTPFILIEESLNLIRSLWMNYDYWLICYDRFRGLYKYKINTQSYFW